MSKALFGHLGGPDPRLLSEVTRLRARVAELEAENETLRARVLIEGALTEGALIQGGARDEVSLVDVLSLDRPSPVPA